MLHNNRQLKSLMDILKLGKYYDIYGIALTVKNGYLTGIFIPTRTKLFIFTRYQSINIDIILRQNLNLVRVLLYLCACKLSE